MVTEDIIVKCLAGEAELHEIAMVEQWRKLSDENERHYLQLSRLWTHSANLEPEFNLDIDKAWNKVVSKVDKPKTKIVTFNARWLAAASVVLLIALAWILFRPKGNEEIQMLSVISTGVKQDINLKDGSKITLLKGEISYPENFAEDSRKLVLKSGTAFFDIDRDSIRPFEIESGATTITVLGTEFEIIKSEGKVKVSVREGKVRFTTPSGISVLTAGMGAEYDENRKSINTSSAENANRFSYATGRLAFNAQTLKAVLKELNAYDPSYRIGADKSIENCKITGTYNMNDGMESILLVIATTLNAELEFEGDRKSVVIKGGTCTP